MKHFMRKLKMGVSVSIILAYLGPSEYVLIELHSDWARDLFGIPN